MTFLSPAVLWLLPLALLPLVGLLHGPRRALRVPWGAGRFLTEVATRATLRLRLQRAARVLAACAALLCLVLGSARPLLVPGRGSGWGAAPELVLVCLDRSPAMEALRGDGQSCRSVVLGAMQQRALAMAGAARFLVADVPHGRALPVEPARLSALAAVSGLDVPCELPRSLAVALERIVAENPGSAEVWIGSGALREAWQPEQPAWSDLRRRLEDCRGRVGVRWFRAPDVQGANRSLRLEAWGRRAATGEPWLRVAVAGRTTEAVRVAVTVGGEPLETVLPPWPGELLVQDLPVPYVGDEPAQGMVELPPDANPADNRAFFALAARQPQRAVVACRDPRTGLLAAAAAAPDPHDRFLQVTRMETVALDPESLAGVALVILDQPPSALAARAALEAFVAAGGSVLVLSGGDSAEAEWLGIARGAAESLGRAVPGRAPEGPERLCQGLPLEGLWTLRRQPLRGGTVLAAFEDGGPLLVRAAVGPGEIVWCAASTARGASNLEQGTVLVPLVQRLLTAGAERLGGVERQECGLLPATAQARCVLPAEEDADRAAGLRAGIVRMPAGAGRIARLLVLARSRRCDDRSPVDAKEIRDLFGDALVADTSGHDTAPREGSGALLSAALAFLGVELLLALAGRAKA